MIPRDTKNAKYLDNSGAAMIPLDSHVIHVIYVPIMSLELYDYFPTSVKQNMMSGAKYKFRALQPVSLVSFWRFWDSKKSND